MLRLSLFFFVALILFFVSCSEHPKNVETVLDKAESNRLELEKVIAHYKKKGDPEKLKAAYFLISNMDDKYSLDGEAVINFDALFDILDSLHQKKIKVPVTPTPILRAAWDSLISKFGYPTRREADRLPDYQHVKAEFLIENIDEAFSTREKRPWLKDLSFDQFCEYILPYRTGTERIEPWRKHLSNEYKVFVDTSVFSNRFELAELFNKYMRTRFTLNQIVREYPFDMTVSQMEKGKRGACIHIVQYEASALRAIGLPVGIDYTPLWGDRDRGHEWNTLLLENDSIFPFDAAQEKFGGIRECPYRFAKVFRLVYATQKIKSSVNKVEIPASLLDAHRIDVTDEYTKTFDIDVPLDFPSKKKNSHAVISTFRSKSWAPQDWGTVNTNRAYFKNMGQNIMYIAMYFDHGRYYPLSHPFVLETDGTIRSITPDKNAKQSVTLFRKYPNFPRNKELMGSMVGLRFQGANKPDFSDSVTLYTITLAPNKFEEVKITNPRKFKYVRCITARGQKMHVAELQFFGTKTSNGKTERLNGKVIGFPAGLPELGTSYPQAFDDNPNTYFLGTDTLYNWAGLQFQYPCEIKGIAYCPRSDTNFIMKGDTYELCYWNKDKWISLGKQVAADQVLTYKNVPSNGLYILHNLTHGKEERIFTYENGEQVWW